jgi:GNAT superfamily N-acetyltransferase
MISCSLATLEDNTPLNRLRMKAMAEAYCVSSNAGIKPRQIYEAFQGYTARNISQPDVWLVRDDSYLIGFMLTSPVEVDGREGIQIEHGYLDPKYASTRISRASLEQVEELSRSNGYQFVSCVTSHDPNVYARWIGRAGYRRDYTAFVKEI